MKIVAAMITLTLISLSMSTNLSAQTTLTENDKHLSEGFMVYYGKDLPGTHPDKEKYDQFIYANETDKQTMLKAFAKDVILPSKQKQLADHQQGVTILEQEVQELQQYIK